MIPITNVASSWPDCVSPRNTNNLQTSRIKATPKVTFQLSKQITNEQKINTARLQNDSIDGIAPYTRNCPS